MDLLPFQRTFIRRALAPDVDIAALSGPRDCGKSTLSAHLLARSLTPGDPLHVPGAENIIIAGRMQQGSIPFRMALQQLGVDRFGKTADGVKRFGLEDNNQSIKAKHLASGTTVRVYPANSKGALGLSGCRLLIADECSSWRGADGEMMWSVIKTSLGKSRMNVILVSTLWPAKPGNWWPRFVRGGSREGVHVKLFAGSEESWDDWNLIRRANPLFGVSPFLRRALKRERADARRDEEAKSEFMSARLNCPQSDSGHALISAEIWRMTLARPVAPADGHVVFGIDLGGVRAWSSIVACWPRTGRVEALAFAGFGDVDVLERRDGVARGTYARLLKSGSLQFDGGRKIPRAGAILAAAVERWGRPAIATGDRHRFGELTDGAAEAGVPLAVRVASSLESDEDVQAVRRLSSNADPGLSIANESRSLLDASLAVAEVTTDSVGHSRLTKRDQNSCSRDDVAAALTLAAGAAVRSPAPRALRWHVAS